MLLNTPIQIKYNIDTIVNLQKTHPYYNWSRRKDYITFLNGSGFLNKTGPDTRHRLFEVHDLCIHIGSFI